MLSLVTRARWFLILTQAALAWPGVNSPTVFWCRFNDRINRPGRCPGQTTATSMRSGLMTCWAILED